MITQYIIITLAADWIFIINITKSFEPRHSKSIKPTDSVANDDSPPISYLRTHRIK